MAQISLININSIIELAKKIITEPREFFEQMPRHGGYSEPLIFITVMGGIAGLIAAALSFVSSGHLGSMSFGMTSIILLPVVAIVGCYIASAIMFVIWKLMGSREDYEASFRCVAYSYVIIPVVVLASVIPYVGTLLANLWWFWLVYIATLTVHKLESQKSAIVLGIIAAVLLIANLAGEKTQREFEQRHNEFNEQMSEIQNMSPEELGEAAGEFLKGLQKSAEEN
jgi:hypothetical protein